MKKEYSTVLNVIEEMMTYFSKLNNEHETKLQEYKAKLFEINIKLDELVKTQNVYSLNVDYRKNISPSDSTDDCQAAYALGAESTLSR